MDSTNKILRDFGDEWERFNFLNGDDLESLKEQFNNYISPLPPEILKRRDLVAADFGAGTGRWSYFFSRYCQQLYILEPSLKAFSVSRLRFLKNKKIILLNQPIEQNDVPEKCLDLAISLGVLHHIHDTQAALNAIYTKLKPGGYFLGYVYYALDNKAPAYRFVWIVSDWLRRGISQLPNRIKFMLTDLIAIFIYLPLSRLCKLLACVKFPITTIPLHHYANLSFTVMRNDALDRFGTSLEKRFKKSEIVEMLNIAGFEISSICFSEVEPFWTFSVRKKDQKF